MSKELEKEAEELIQSVEMANSMNCFMQLTPDRKQIGEMLVMIAEPREKRIVELEKENTELREQCIVLADCNTCASTCKTENLEMKSNLIKAKEIILTLLNNFAYPIGREDWTVEDVEIVDKAEQFLERGLGEDK